MSLYILIALLFLVGILFMSGIRIVRPTHYMLIETLGKYSRLKTQGFTWVIPIIQSTHYVNITEQMVTAEPQEIITKDSLNATVDAQVYFKVKEDEASIKASQYNVNNYKVQIVNLARTTLRNIIGTMKLKEANSERDKINQALLKTLLTETKSWGIAIVRTELKEIAPPRDVQETMNKVVKAENEKNAAVDFATAEETRADGTKRAKIKEAEGQKQAEILRAEGQKLASISIAEGQAKAFNLVDESFKGGAKALKELEVTENSLKQNSKIILGDKGKDILKLLNVDK